MNLRKIIAGIIAILTFIGVLTLISTAVHTIWPDYWFSDHPIERVIALFVGFVVALMVYNLIKGKEPEKIKEKQGITRDEISKRLEEKRKN